MSRLLIDLSQLDWQLLKKQKQALVDVIHQQSKVYPPAVTNHLTGLIHLLDHIQDEAAKVLGEEAVFGEKNLTDK